jgi:tetratricopeptide (TPR) repeat protein/CHAT domain-containing protein
MAIPCLLLTLLDPVSRAAEEAPPVRFQDDFAADTRKDYETKGDLTWQKGALTLGKEATVSRKLALGYSTEVRAVVRWDKDQRDGQVILRLADAKQRGEVLLRLAEGRTALVLPGRPERVIALEAGGAKLEAVPIWVVRLEVSYGLLRARAWPQGTEEPADWLFIVYLGVTAWQPERLELVTGPSGGVCLERWAVRGVAPLRLSAEPLRLSAGQQRDVQRASALYQEAAALDRQGQYPKAVTKAREALAIRRKVLPPLHPDLAQSLDYLSWLLQNTGRHDEARQYIEDALAIRRKVLPPHHPDLASSLGNLGLLLRAMGRHDEARKHLKEALAISRRALPPLHPDLAASLNNLGTLLRDMGRHDEGRKHLEEALAICRKVLPPLHPNLATCLGNLGLLLWDMGRHDEARKHYEEALAICRKALPPLHPNLATSLNNLGRLLRDMGRHDEARKHLEEALAIRRKALPPLHPNLANSLQDLGLLLKDMGRHNEARKHLEEALAIKRKALPPLHPNLANSLNNLGTLLQEMGQHDEARKCYEEALAISRKALPSLHPHLAISLNNLFELLHTLGENEAAWRCLQEAATIQAAFTARTAAGSAQLDHAALARQGHPILHRFLSLAEQAASLSARQRQQVLAALLDGKALSGTALARQREAVVLQQDAQTAALLGRLQPLRRRLADLLLQGPGTLPPQRYRDLCEQVQKEHDDLERDLALRVKDYAELRRSQQAGPHDLAAQLAPGAALVELVRYQRFDFQAKDRRKRWGAEHYLATLLWREAGAKTQPQVRLVPLGKAQPIDHAIHAWLDHAQDGTIDDKSDAELRKRVWEPLARALPESTMRLFLAPDGELALLPFEALRAADGTYLVERLHLSYLTTGRDLMPRPQPQEKSNLALVLADPDYDATAAQDKRVGQANPAAPHRRDDDFTRQFKFKPLKSLEGFAREADAVQKLLQGRGAWRVRLHTGADASEETLRSAPRPRLLYCITHGFFLEDRPHAAASNSREFELVSDGRTKWRLPDAGPDPRLASGLALAGANRWHERAQRGVSDGLLTALEAEDLDLWGTELVVLSACETGRGEVRVGEGVLGLRRAFQQAGARTVLASLWKVPDAETEQLMKAFLRRWLGGEGKAESLRQAQLDLIGRLREGKDEFKRAAPPLYWAGFICHGQPR